MLFRAACAKTTGWSMDRKASKMSIIPAIWKSSKNEIGSNVILTKLFKKNPKSKNFNVKEQNFLLQTHIQTDKETNILIEAIYIEQALRAKLSLLVQLIVKYCWNRLFTPKLSI